MGVTATRLASVTSLGAVYPSELTNPTPVSARAQDIHTRGDTGCLLNHHESMSGMRMVDSCAKTAARMAVVDWIPRSKKVSPRYSHTPSSNPLCHVGVASVWVLLVGAVVSVVVFLEVDAVRWKFLISVRDKNEMIVEKKSNSRGGGA
jgi:hypothetical protein